MKQFKLLYAIVAFAIFSFGCVKKRPDRAAPNSLLHQGELSDRKAFLEKVELLKAVSADEKSQLYSYKITVEESARHLFDELGYVKYETKSKFFKNPIQVLGKVGVTYKLARKLIGNKLVIFKVAKPENISYLEKSELVQNFPNGEIGVPLISYPVSYFNVQYDVDSDNRKTNQKREVPIYEISEYSNASHIRIDYTSRYDYLKESKVQRTGLLPKSFFEGSEWYYSVFRVGASGHGYGGNQFAFIVTEKDGRYGIYKRVKLKPSDRETFSGVSTVVAEQFKGKDLNDTPVVSLKGDWVKFRKTKEATGAETEEEDRLATYKNSTHFKVDFLESYNESKKNLHGVADHSDAKKVVEVIFSKNLFSYIVETDHSRYRVNFLRKKSSSYVPVAVNQSDIENRFGAMYISLPQGAKHLSSRTQDDVEKQYRLLRFDPDKKEIAYHIAEGSPKTESVKKSSQKAVAAIDSSFKYIYKDDPKSQIRVVLKETRKRRGDPRYNIIDYNAQDNVHTSGGVGNPYYDELTGEIIAATSFIYYGIYEDLVADALTEYLMTKTGFYDTRLFVQRRSSRGSHGEDSYSNTLDSLEDYPLISYFEKPEGLSKVKNLIVEKGYRASDYHLSLGEGSHFSITNTCAEEDCKPSLIRHGEKALKRFGDNKNPRLFFQQFAANNSPGAYKKSELHGVGHINRRSIFKKIEEADYCKHEVLQEEYEELAGSVEFLGSEEAKKCVQGLMIAKLTQTVSHEILHNLGEEHNMSASTDKENRLTPELFNEVYGVSVASDRQFISSSIMDYFDYRSEVLNYPAPYDWATLRFIYRSQAELSSGEFVSLEKERVKSQGLDLIRTYSLDDYEEHKSKKFKKYVYCSPWEEYVGLNPMCSTFDIGFTPSEIAENYIQEYLYLNNFILTRGVRNKFMWGFLSHRTKYRISMQLLKLYHKWRSELIEVMGEREKYLGKYFSSEDFYKDFHQNLNLLSQDRRAEVLEWFRVRDKVFSFFRDEFFRAPYSCLFGHVEKPGVIALVEYDEAYKLAYARDEGREKLDLDKGCASEEIRDAAEQIFTDKINKIEPGQERVKFVYKSEVGVPVRNYSYRPDLSRDLGDRSDVYGGLSQKYVAMQILLNRLTAVSSYDSSLFFYPSMVDEPDLRDNFNFFVKTRYSKGFWYSQDGAYESKVGFEPSIFPFAKEISSKSYGKVVAEAYKGRSVADHLSYISFPKVFPGIADTSAANEVFVQLRKAAEGNKNLFSTLLRKMPGVLTEEELVGQGGEVEEIMQAISGLEIKTLEKYFLEGYEPLLDKAKRWRKHINLQEVVKKIDNKVQAGEPFAEELFSHVDFSENESPSKVETELILAIQDKNINRVNDLVEDENFVSNLAFKWAVEAVGSVPLYQNFSISRHMENRGDEASYVTEKLGKTMHSGGFASESFVLSMMPYFFTMGLLVPGDPDATKERFKPYKTGIAAVNDSGQVRYVKSTQEVWADFGSVLLYPYDKDSVFTTELILAADKISEGLKYAELIHKNKVEAPNFRMIQENSVSELQRLFSSFQKQQDGTFRTADKQKPTVKYYASLVAEYGFLIAAKTESLFETGVYDKVTYDAAKNFNDAFTAGMLEFVQETASLENKLFKVVGIDGKARNYVDALLNTRESVSNSGEIKVTGLASEDTLGEGIKTKIEIMLAQLNAFESQVSILREEKNQAGNPTGRTVPVLDAEHAVKLANLYLSKVEKNYLAQHRNGKLTFALEAEYREKKGILGHFLKALSYISLVH